MLLLLGSLKVKRLEFLDPYSLHNSFQNCIGCVEHSKIGMIVSKIMAKLKFNF